MKKMIRRALTLTLAVLMVLSLGTTAFATEGIFTSAPANVTIINEPETLAGEIGGNYDSFINIKKVFKGLPYELIPDDFEISVTQVNEDGTPILDENGQPKTSIKRINKTAHGPNAGNVYEFNWKIEVPSDVHYLVNEANFDRTNFGYDCTISPALPTRVFVEPDVESIGVLADNCPCSDGTIDLTNKGKVEIPDGRDWVLAVAAKSAGVIILSTVDLSLPVRESIEKSLGIDNNQDSGNFKGSLGITYCNVSDGQPHSFPTNNGKGDIATFQYFADRKAIVVNSTDGQSYWTTCKLLSYVKTDVVKPLVTITNTYTPLTTDVKVNKIWDDDNYIAARPESITVELYADYGDGNGAVQVIDEDGNPITAVITPDENGVWPSYTFEDLPQYRDGWKVAYSVRESNFGNNYESSVDRITDPDGNVEYVFNITNTLQTTTVTFTKQITGSMGDPSKEFWIYVTFSKPIGAGDGYTVVDDNDTTVTDGTGTIAKFKLSDEGHVTIKDVPVDAVITGIRETDVHGNPLDSDWSMKLWKPEIGENNGVSLPIEVDDTGMAITIENNKEGTPDTGVILDSLPYVLILGLVVVGFLFLRKRRHSDDD